MQRIAALPQAFVNHAAGGPGQRELSFA